MCVAAFLRQRGVRFLAAVPEVCCTLAFWPFFYETDTSLRDVSLKKFVFDMQEDMAHSSLLTWIHDQLPGIYDQSSHGVSNFCLNAASPLDISSH